MKDLSHKEQELVAIGAAIASNCVPCIEYHIPHAREAGLSDAQIEEVVRMADRVRQVPATKVLQTAAALLGESVVPGGSTRSGGAISSGQGQCCGPQPDTVQNSVTVKADLDVEDQPTSE